MDDAQLDANTMWEPNSGCLIWLASLNGNGYGQVRYEGRNHLSHRLFYKKQFGSIPDGVCVLHRCDNRACVNPEHLFLGTRDDNQKDMAKKGRWKNKVFEGEQNGFAKLTEVQVLEIRATGGLQREIAEQYGITQTAVSAIKRRAAWRHL